MRDDARQARHEAIMDAAYQVMEEKGFAGLSILAVARAARASNETLYRWYGDKTGLFAALIAHNAASVASELQADAARAPMDRLARLGPRLLAMLLGARAVTLNQAAAADATGTLGAALARAGRGSIAPHVTALMAEAQAAGALGAGPPEDLAEAYLANLVGDLQIRRVTGAMPPLPPDRIEARAATALARLRTLFPGDA